ncbi:hypothetical protein OG588_15025 [Streptomyces prunicolor]|uniref:DUF7674 family protein n=1 Tax=Streptomyces prunicolor TaxID=67348 RepID=UPI0038673C69|nr:hypothetical protein OG588_15025 [Streptomyces prunicolor]
MSADVQLVKDLVTRFPILEDSYESHVFNNMDELLPHVYFYEVSQEVVQSFISRDPDALDWRSVLAFLEEQLNRGVLAVTEVIVTSFLWYMPNPGDPGHEIVSHLGPTMTRKFHEVRPGE